MAGHDRRGADAAQSFDATILLAEDNLINQRVARLILERLGCRVDVAGNGKEAVEMVRAGTYDLVIMDCQMPEMDGYRATQEIRRLEAGGRRIPILAMTAHAMAGDRENCLDCGMDDYMTKPVRREVVCAMLERWLPAKPAAPQAESSGEAELSRLEPEMPVVLRELAEDGGEDFIVDLVARYLKNTRLRLAALADAIAAEDLAAADPVAHEIKGSSGTIGARKLAALCRELETALANRSFSTAAELCARLNADFARVADALGATSITRSFDASESRERPRVQ